MSLATYRLKSSEWKSTPSPKQEKYNEIEYLHPLQWDFKIPKTKGLSEKTSRGKGHNYEGTTTKLIADFSLATVDAQRQGAIRASRCWEKEPDHLEFYTAWYSPSKERQNKDSKVNKDMESLPSIWSRWTKGSTSVRRKLNPEGRLRYKKQEWGEAFLSVLAKVSEQWLIFF